MKEEGLDRRNFIKYSTLSAVLAGIALPSCSLLKGDASGQPAGLPHSKTNKSHYFDKKIRLTIAMWDFSWLTANHKGGVYEDLERRVAEAAQRGYNTLRVDCFPSRILEGKTTFKKNHNPKVQLPAWGQAAVDYECNVLERLSVLAEVCRKNKIWLGLDAWEKGHMIKNDNAAPLGISGVITPGEEEKIFTQFSQTWVKAIKLMREAGIMERAVWIAPMNEVAHFGSRSIKSITDIDSKEKNEGETVLEKNKKINDKYQQINHWMGEAIKQEIGRDKIPLSYSSSGPEEYSKRLTDIYDVADIHFLPNLIIHKQDTAAFVKMNKGGRGFAFFENMESLKDYVALWNEVCKNNYAEMLKRTSEYCNTALDNLVLKSGKKLTSVITESFGPCFWPDRADVNWEWYKMYNGDSARIAASLPFEGVSLSNYGEPLFSLWDDIDWHRNANLFTLNVL